MKKTHLLLNFIIGSSIVTLFPASNFATTYTWVPSAGGTYNWSTPSNWNPSGIPNAVDSIADINITSAYSQTINLTQSITLGQLNQTIATGGSVTYGGTSPFIFQTSSVSPALSGGATFNCPVTINTQLFVTGLGFINSSGALTLASTSSLYLTDVTGPQTVGDILGSGNLSLGNSTFTFGTANSTTFSGALGLGSGTLIKQGTGTLTLDSSAFLNVANFFIEQGNVITANRVTIFGSCSIPSGSTLDLSASISSSYIETLSGAGDIILTSPQTGHVLQIGSVNSSTFSGVMSGIGAMRVVQGPETLTLTGANTYSGGTSITAGQLSLSGGGSLLSTGSVAISSGAIFDISGSTLNQTIGDLSGAGNVTLGSKFLTAGTSNSTTYSGIMSGTGGFTMEGSGTLTFGGANTYSGGTTITGNGTIGLSSTGSLNSSGAVSISSGSTFNLSSATGNQTIGDLSGAGSVVLGANSLMAGTATTSKTFSGGISGTGGFTKAGTGTLLFSGTNSYSGGTSITAGQLSLSGGGSLLSTGSVSVSSGGTFDISGSTGNQTIGDLSGAGFVTLGANFLTEGTANLTTYSGIMSGTGGLVKTGSGSLTLSGANTYSGGTTINNGAIALSPTGSLNSSGAVSVGSLGTFNLSSATGNQTIGDLSGAGNVILGANFLTAGTSNSTTFSGGISGTGGFIKAGSGTLTITGNNTYSGLTSVTAGKLALSGSGAFLSTENFSVSLEFF